MLEHNATELKKFFSNECCKKSDKIENIISNINLAISDLKKKYQNGGFIIPPNNFDFKIEHYLSYDELETIKSVLKGNGFNTGIITFINDDIVIINISW